MATGDRMRPLLPGLQLPSSSHQEHRRAQESFPRGSSGLGRFRKAGWCKKTGVVFKNPTRPGVALTDAEVRQLAGADVSTACTVMPPPISLSQLQVTTNVKTRFLLLLEYRLQYGSTSTFEAFQKGGVSACSSEILGELFLTGDAWARPVDATSVVVCGDPAMMKKAGKLYLLTFSSADIRLEWELAMHFFLFRAVPSERMERLLLSGWISAFPNLGSRMDRVVGRRMSIVAAPRRRAVGAASQEEPHQATALPPKRGEVGAFGRTASVDPSTASASEKIEDDEDAEGGAVLDVVSEDDNDESSEGEEGTNGSSSSAATAAPTMTKKKSEMSAAFASFMHSKRHRHVVNADDDNATSVTAVDRRGNEKCGGSSANDILFAHAIDEINNNGMHFLLRCQRPMCHHEDSAARASSAGAAGDRPLAAPRPSYLCIQWLRASHTVHSVPVLRETCDASCAARFALRSFAESAQQYSPPRVVLVDAPSWQLYTRAAGGGELDGRDVGESRASTEREIILRPVFPVTTLPSPTVTGAQVPSSSAAVTLASAIRNHPWAFRALAWEGASVEREGDVHNRSLATFSFLLEGATTLAPQRRLSGFRKPVPSDASNDTHHPDDADGSEQNKYIVALSDTGKLFIVNSQHAANRGGVAKDATEKCAASFVPLEVVPATSDADIQFQLDHQTPAMRERALYRAATRAMSANFLQQGLLEPFRIVLVGASGSGKSTVAQWVDKHSLHSQQKQPTMGFPGEKSGGSGSVDAQTPPSAPIADHQLSKRIHTINCNGIAVPVVLTEVPSTASAAYLRTQCTGADLVVCLFDVSDEHSLQWLEGNMGAICSDVKDEALGTASVKRKYDANVDGSGGAAGSNLPASLPRTRFILCATRVDSLRVAVDSYRLEAFRTATEPFTGPSSIAWQQSLDVIFSAGKGDYDGGGRATTPNRGGAPLLTALLSSHSFSSSNDSPEEAALPFVQFGSRWRMWRLPTATRATASTEFQTMLGECNLSESFLFSPNLRRLAAEGTTLPERLGVSTPKVPPPGGSFSSKDPLASTHRATQGQNLNNEEENDDDLTIGNKGEDDEEDWKVPRHMMQSLGSVLEELYLVRIGKSLGWSEGMISRFAVASCVANMDARRRTSSTHDASDESKANGSAEAEDNTHPTTAMPGRIVSAIFSLLHLPSAFQCDVVREALHTPKSAPSRSGPLFKPVIPATGNSSCTTPPRQHEYSPGTGGGVREASSVLMSSSISAIGPEIMRRLWDPSLTPMSSTTKKMHGGVAGAAATWGSSGKPPRTVLDSSSYFHHTAGAFTDSKNDFHSESLVKTMSQFPLDDSLSVNHLMSPQGPSSVDGRSPMRRSLMGFGGMPTYQPTWKEVIASSLRQWHEHWLVFRWIVASAAAGDVRAELIMSMLRGEHDEFLFLPTSAKQKQSLLQTCSRSKSNGAGGGGGGPPPIPVVRLPLIGVLEDNDVNSMALVSCALRDMYGGDEHTTRTSSSGGEDARSHHSLGSSVILVGRTSSSSDSGAARDGCDAEGTDVENGHIHGNQRRRLWLPIQVTPRPMETCVVLTADAAPSSGGVPEAQLAAVQAQQHGRRVFHPMDLLYLSFGSHVPKDPPPCHVPDAALWIYQQPQKVWPAASARQKGPTVSSASSRFGHVSPVMLETMFSIVGIELQRDHTSRLLRWADTNGDRLTDASDFMRWFSWLLFCLSIDHKAQRISAAPPDLTSDPLGGPARRSEAVAPRVATLSPAGAAVSSYLSLLSTLWALRVYQWIPMLEALGAAFRSGLSRDRAWAAAACAQASNVRPDGIHRIVAIFRPSGGCDWDDDDSNIVGAGGSTSSVPDAANQSASAGSIFSRMASALGIRVGGPSDASPSVACCHRCRMTFRAVFRPSIECQTCHHKFCARCCKSIIVLNESNKTEKRKLCHACRRSHSTFLDDYDEADDASDARQTKRSKEVPPPSATHGGSPVGGTHGKVPRAHSSNTVDSVGHGSSTRDSSGNLPQPTPTTTKEEGGGGVAAATVWEDDGLFCCSICASSFTVLRRRHHCRLCGALVCGACSPHTITVKDFVGPQRMCVSCFQGRRVLEANQERRRLAHQSINTKGGEQGARTPAEAQQPSITAEADHSTPTETAGQRRNSQAQSIHHASSSPTSNAPLNAVAENLHDGRKSATTAAHPGGSQTRWSASSETEALRLRRQQEWRALDRQLKKHQQELRTGTSAGNKRKQIDTEESMLMDEWGWLALTAPVGGASPKMDHPLVRQPWHETYSVHNERDLLQAARRVLEEQARTVQYLLSQPGGRSAIEAERGPLWSYTVYQPGWFAPHDHLLEESYNATQLEEMGPDVGPH